MNREAMDCDVVVVGGGNAALCAALAAKEAGAQVVVVEKAPPEWRGGNSYFTAGVFRFPFGGLADVRELVPELSEAEAARYDLDPYTEDDFFQDLLRLTEGLTDPDLADYLVRHAADTVRWLRQKGVRFGLLLRRQTFEVGGRVRFWGGLVVEAVGGGPGLVDTLYQLAEAEGISVRYRTKAERLLTDADGRIGGVVVRSSGRRETLRTRAVVLACGGFEANPEMRARYLGTDWDLVPVRGTPYNTGDGIRMALEAGAASFGNWSGCHAVAWDANAPPYGDRRVGDAFQKHSYPLGIMVNRNGQRFVDEGADFRNYTYAEYGRAILAQPGRIAFQIFDAQTVPLLRDEYRIREVTRTEAGSIRELARALDIDPDRLEETVNAFNRAIRRQMPFNPAVKDGRRTEGIWPPKSNWALAIDQPPFVAFSVTCGITFTFGGVRINLQGQVLDTEGHPIPGLFAAGEMVGGLFYRNYPGGAGLSAGAVFGRLAGRTAGSWR